MTDAATITTGAATAAAADNPLAAGAALVDGQIVPIAEARIPITDTGFTRSDLTYDVVAVWGGAFFRLDDHLDRFERGCGKLRLDPGLNRGELQSALHELVRATGLREAYVDIICTRGTPPVWRTPPALLAAVAQITERSQLRVLEVSVPAVCPGELSESWQAWLTFDLFTERQMRSAWPLCPPQNFGISSLHIMA